MSDDKHIKALKEYSGKGIPVPLILGAIGGLKDPTDIKQYFEAYISQVKEHVESDYEQRNLGEIAYVQLKKGRSPDFIAEALARDHVTYFLSKFNDKKVHKAWSAAMPSLYPKGRLLNLVESHTAALLS